MLLRIILMINNNNKLPSQQLSLALLLPLLLCAHSAATPRATTTPHATQLTDLSALTLHRQGQAYLFPLTINHHTFKLNPQLQAGRTWLKETLCKVCDLATQQCTHSCFINKDEGRISCDSSFCNEVGDYLDESRGLAGKEAEVFLKIGNSSQILMPMILSTKLYQSHVQTGEFFLFDPESSFSSGIIARTPQGSIQLHNLEKIEKEQLGRLRQEQGKPLNISMSGEQFDFSFLKINNVLMHHVSNTSYADFTDDNLYEMAFSLQALPIVFPLKLVKKIEKYLNEAYLPGKKCKLLPKKLKCSGSIDMQDVFRALFHFHLNQYLLPIPIHLLVTGCSSNQCTTLITFEESAQNTITFGTVIWQLYNLQYDLEKKYAIFHRRTSQYDDLFVLDKIELSQAGFGYKLLIITYHCFRYLLIALFWLAIFSIIVNAIIKWRSILSCFRAILIRRKQRRVSQVQQSELYQQKPLRKISKLPEPFDDFETI